MHARLPVAILAACLAALPAQSAEWSWDPMKDVENALPPEAPNESKIIQGRHQVREMAQDALASLYEIVPGARKAIERSAGYAAFTAPSASSCSSLAAPAERESW
jgi:hypothetical protein